MTKLLVIGVDGATWKVIKPNLDSLPNLKKMIEEGASGTIVLPEGEAVISPAIWTTMFSGVPGSQHGHEKYVKNGELQKREDIPVKFCWDLLPDKIVALQVPFIIPPYNWNCDYMPPGFGASKEEGELHQDVAGITAKAKEILAANPECAIVCYNHLDRVQHFHWGEGEYILEWYKLIDEQIGQLIGKAEKTIIISDHGFCGVGEARTNTLPKVAADGQHLKGDHHEEAIIITKGIGHEITHPADVFKTIMEMF
ncbi:alkaline phosphatase family protein [archaeon]